jgi:hypothetical protein
MTFLEDPVGFQNKVVVITRKKSQYRKIPTTTSDISDFLIENTLLRWDFQYQ